MRAAAQLPAGGDQDRAWHRARKAAKRARYTADALTGVLGSRAAGTSRTQAYAFGVLRERQRATSAADIAAAVAAARL